MLYMTPKEIFDDIFGEDPPFTVPVAYGWLRKNGVAWHLRCDKTEEFYRVYAVVIDHENDELVPQPASKTMGREEAILRFCLSRSIAKRKYLDI